MAEHNGNMRHEQESVPSETQFVIAKITANYLSRPLFNRHKIKCE